jgi:hypothetical protein
MSRYSSTSSRKNAILTTYRITINNDFRKNSSPKSSRTTRKSIFLKFVPLFSYSYNQHLIPHLIFFFAAETNLTLNLV